MAGRERLICASAELIEGGEGFRFPLSTVWGDEVGFVVRFQGEPVAYVDRCAHVPVELDWQKGRFFDVDRRYLICSVHGALFEPSSGRCVSGPCRGGRLAPLTVVERDGQVFLVEPEQGPVRAG